VRENGSVASRILVDCGADAGRVREAVMNMLSGPRPRSPRVVGSDRSSFDFTPDEAFALTRRLASLSRTVTFEVRRHGEQPPTFRVSCQPLAAEDTLRKLVALEADGIGVVLDLGDSVRLRHIDRSFGTD
jgi:hypothetical protein